jgi:RNA polymerase sigma factor (sigma-70 family)
VELEKSYDAMRRLARYWLRPDMSVASGDLASAAVAKILRASRTRPYYGEILRDPKHPEFYPVVRQVMRNLVVDYWKKRSQRLSAHRGLATETIELHRDREESIEAAILLIDAVEKLETDPSISPARRARVSRVLHLHLFGTKTLEEIAEIIDSSVTTVHRDLELARAWLRCEVDQERAALERERASNVLGRAL